MSVFALRPYIFYKYVFEIMEYVVLFIKVFSYFMKTYDNKSTSKYVCKSLFYYTNLHTYANCLIYSTKYACILFIMVLISMNVVRAGTLG